MAKKLKALFVTGTDTGIGKTVVSTILTVGLKGRYWKPIQAGLSEETDSQFVARFIEGPSILPEIYRLAHPLSPHQAALLEGRSIDLKDISLPPLSSAEGPLVVEGAGGVLVPLNGREMMVDLMGKLRIPLLVVARSSLGTLNHTLLTLEALRKRKLPLLGLALVGEKNPPNKETLEKWGKIPVLMEIGHLKSFGLEVFRSLFRESKMSEYF